MRVLKPQLPVCSQKCVSVCVVVVCVCEGVYAVAVAAAEDENDPLWIKVAAELRNPGPYWPAKLAAA